MAEQAVRARQTHVGYLEALLAAELEEREKNTVERRIREARLPKTKTLEEFDFSQARKISAAQMRDLADSGYIDRAEPIVLIGDCGTGKTHLLSGLCVAACRQKRRVRFTTAAALVNELVEAQTPTQLRRVLARWARYELIGIDEVGYVPMAEPEPTLTGSEGRSKNEKERNRTTTAPQGRQGKAPPRDNGKSIT
jgi:DNA replication protein DnaC